MTLRWRVRTTTIGAWASGRGPLLPALTVAFLLGLVPAPRATAGNLADFVQDLYGSEITLDFALGRGGPVEFRDIQFPGLTSLQSDLAASLSFLSVNATAAGFTFDLERGVPVRTTDSFGPLIAERANTLGQGRLNVAVSYTRLDFRRFQGEQLDDFTVSLPNRTDINDDGMLGGSPTFSFELDRVRLDLDLELEEEVLAIFARYGITPRFDVGFVAPLSRVRAHAESRGRIEYGDPRQEYLQPTRRGDEPDELFDLTMPRSNGGTESGLGDVLLQGKYHLWKARDTIPDLGVLGQVKLATGNEEDLLGTGETNFLLLLIASRSWRSLTPHLNVGYEVSTGPSELDNLRYTAGVDARLLPRVTVALDVVGRFGPDADDSSDHLVDLGAGVKWELFRSLLLNVNLLFPLNRNEGLRPDVTWTVGFEYTFGLD